MDVEWGGGPVMTVLGAEGPPPTPPEKPTTNWWKAAEPRRRLLTGAVLVWAIAITAVVLVRAGDDPGTPAATVPSAKPSASAGPLSVAEVYRTLRPSVVLIQTAGRGGSGLGRDPRTAVKSATGTGVIVNADGTILTAHHVVDGATSITVTYADGTASAARVTTANAARDIATLAPAKLPEVVVPAVLGGGAAVGDDVVAIGNPLGLTATTTSGVISALDRSLSDDGSGAIAGLIQFDAAVNPGNSGGPLLNRAGQVVGIVTALANPARQDFFVGIGFAVPIADAGGVAGGPQQ
jgi:S1-C subfamily serine protease